MANSLKIEELYIGNPVFPYTYFPYYHEKKQIPFALLSGDLSSEEIDKLCLEIKNELFLKHLDWGTSCGRDIINISVDDLPRVYEIARAFVKRKHGVYMQDLTQITFSKLEDISYEGQQRLLLKSLLELEKYNMMNLCKLPIHRSVFWLLEEGKQLAKRIRDKSYGELKDILDPRDMHIGEYFTEIAPKKEKVKDKEEIPEEKKEKEKDKIEDDGPIDCIICLEKKANTQVLPCKHIVVCKDCSDELKNDRINAHICVYCRQKIEVVKDVIDIVL